MAQAKFIPAVTETKVIEKEHAKVTLELSVEEARRLVGVLGATSGSKLLPLYRELKRTLGAAGFPYKSCGFDRLGPNEDNIDLTEPEDE